MPEKLPWEIAKYSMSVFAHDAANQIYYSIPSIDIVAHYAKSREMKALGLELTTVGKALSDIHGQFFGFRNSDTAPRNWERTLVAYRRTVKKRNEKVRSISARLKLFKKKNGKTLNEEATKYLNKAIDRLSEFQKEFAAENLGRKVHANPVRANLRSFLKTALSQEFVDRDGKPVKVIFRGKDIGKASFDKILLKRSLFNLVTDALNHRPGRPIFVTLSVNRKSGQAEINVTNHGRKLTEAEIAKIGKVRFTRAMHDPKRGYGKISVRVLTEAQGGSFRAGNSRIGPMLSMKLPIRRRRAG